MREKQEGTDLSSARRVMRETWETYDESSREDCEKAWGRRAQTRILQTAWRESCWQQDDESSRANNWRKRVGCTTGRRVQSSEL